MEKEISCSSQLYRYNCIDIVFKMRCCSSSILLFYQTFNSCHIKKDLRIVLFSVLLLQIVITVLLYSYEQACRIVCFCPRWCDTRFISVFPYASSSHKATRRGEWSDYVFVILLPHIFSSFSSVKAKEKMKRVLQQQRQKETSLQTCVWIWTY